MRRFTATFRDELLAWVLRWGFATLVGIAALIGLASGLMVTVPAHVPDVALRASPVYRLEVGGVFFVGLYLTSMAFVLALHNRGFTEFGTGGVRAESLARIPRALAAEDSSFERLRQVMGELKRLQELEERD